MNKIQMDGVFKKPSAEAKGEATTRAAREIIARETAERDAKTARLRALRLAKEKDDAAIAAAAPPPPAKKERKRAVKA